MDVRADVAVTLAAGDDDAELLLLQGRPLAELAAQYGPFVLNTKAEVSARREEPGHAEDEPGIGLPGSRGMSSTTSVTY